MRIADWLALVALATQAACTVPPHAAPPAAFDTDARMAQWVALWNNYDLDRVSELFLDDDRVTYLSSEREGLIAGSAALRAHHEGLGFVPGGREAEQELWVEDVRSEMYGPTAVVSATWFFGDRAAPRERVQRGPLTAVFTWTDVGYRIAHMHFANY